MLRTSPAFPLPGMWLAVLAKFAMYIPNWSIELRSVTVVVNNPPSSYRLSRFY